MKALRLSNTTDVAFSASPASAGGHEALRHIPGSALWGLVAGAHYRSGGDTFVAAHSGDLRVSPGFPLVGGEPAFPAPQTLRRPKHQSGFGDDGWLADSVWNPIWPITGDQPGPGEALKRWYLTAAGRVVKPDVAERGKTAIRAGDRRAADGQYFQYEHLEGGQDWVTWIDGTGDEAASSTLAAGSLRLGRSRLPEYGGAFGVTPLPDWRDPRTDQWAETARETLVLWCLSDLACTDEWGMPSLSPSPEDLGVGAFPGKLDMARSAIMTRRYAPWNTYLRAPDREHAVIEAGSVLVYALTGPVDLGPFREGCGRWRERGLGLVWPNPPLLMKVRPGEGLSRPSLPDASRDRKAPSGELSGSETLIVSVLKARLQSRNAEAKIDKDAGRLIQQLLTSLTAAAARGEQTPGPSQWSLVAGAADGSPDTAALHRALLELGGLCVGAANPEWQSMAAVLENILQQDDVTPGAIGRAAWRLRDQWKGGLQ